MATVYKRRVERLAKKLGATIEDNSASGNSWDYNIDVPRGFKWKAAGIHTLVCCCYKGNMAWREEAFEDALERMSDGLEPCDEGEDCDYCNEEEA